MHDLNVFFIARFVRMFAYGLLSLTLALSLSNRGLNENDIGLIFSLAFLGDIALSLTVSTWADRLGRRRVLMISSLLMVGSGITFAYADNYALLLIAAFAGIIAPGDKDIGPFLSIEQSSMAQLAGDTRRTVLFGRYNLLGSAAVALGTLSCGWVVEFIHESTGEIGISYRTISLAYSACGLVLFAVYQRLTNSIEPVPQHRKESFAPLKLQSRPIVSKLSALFALDAFAGGFIVQSMIAFWFHDRFGVPVSILGTIFFGANVLSAVSALLASRLATRFGLINTMVFTHIPSSILLMLIPLMPTLTLAVTVLLLRFTISQMDVPTRQSYTVAVVHPSERTAATSITSVARSIGASLSPVLAGYLFASSALTSLPFFAAGGLKILYDFLLYVNFRKLRPPEEQ